MCQDPSEPIITFELVLRAPCGKTVAMTMPSEFSPRGDDEDIGAALGAFVRALGYSRRGWQLEVTRLTRYLSGSGIEHRETTRFIHSR